MIYYNKNNKNNKNNKKNNITKKFSPSELLNSQKTKKAFVRNYNGGKRNKRNKIDKKYKNYNISKYFSFDDKDESDREGIQDGGKYKRSKELNKIIVKTYKIYTKLKDKYFPKLLTVFDILYSEEQTYGITKIQRYVEHILELEQYKFNSHKEKQQGNNMALNVTRIDDIKEIEAIYTKTLGGYKHKLTGVDKMNIDKRARKLQDYLRKKMMKKTTFNKVKDLKCGKYDTDKKNKLICNISSYRKIEAKINKQYKKMHIQFNRFINTLPLKCSQLETFKDEMKKLPSQNNDVKLGDNKSLILPPFDFTLCDGYEKLNEKISQSAAKSVKLLETEKLEFESNSLKKKQEGINEKYSNYKTKQNKKIKKINEKYEKAKALYQSINKDFTAIFKNFRLFVTDIDEKFRNLDGIGLHRYVSNFPEDSKKELDYQLESLSTNKDFIQTFTEKLKPYGNMADSLMKIFDPQDEEFTRELIPKLVKKRPTSAAPANNNVTYLNINMELSIHKTHPLITDVANTMIGNITTVNNVIDNTIGILCFQNLEKLYDEINIIEAPPAAAPLARFKKISYCECGTGERNTKSELKYNAIYYNTDMFNNYNETESIDQSAYFKLQDTPQGMTINDYRSFTAINIIDHEFNTPMAEANTPKFERIFSELSKFDIDMLVPKDEDIYTSSSYVDYKNKIEKKLEDEILRFKKNYFSFLNNEQKTEIEKTLNVFRVYSKYKQIKTMYEEIFNVQKLVRGTTTDVSGNLIINCNTIKNNIDNKTIEKFINNMYYDIINTDKFDELKEQLKYTLEPYTNIETIIKKHKYIDNPTKFTEFLSDVVELHGELLNEYTSKIQKIKDITVAAGRAGRAAIGTGPEEFLNFTSFTDATPSFDTFKTALITHISSFDIDLTDHTDHTIANIRVIIDEIENNTNFTLFKNDILKYYTIHLQNLKQIEPIFAGTNIISVNFTLRVKNINTLITFFNNTNISKNDDIVIFKSTTNISRTGDGINKLRKCEKLFMDIILFLDENIKSKNDADIKKLADFIKKLNIAPNPDRGANFIQFLCNEIEGQENNIYEKKNIFCKTVINSISESQNKIKTQTGFFREFFEVLDLTDNATNTRKEAIEKCLTEIGDFLNNNDCFKPKKKEMLKNLYNGYIKSLSTNYDGNITDANTKNLIAFIYMCYYTFYIDILYNKNYPYSPKDDSNTKGKEIIEKFKTKKFSDILTIYFDSAKGHIDSLTYVAVYNIINNIISQTGADAATTATAIDGAATAVVVAANVPAAAPIAPAVFIPPSNTVTAIKTAIDDAAPAAAAAVAANTFTKNTITNLLDSALTITGVTTDMITGAITKINSVMDLIAIAAATGVTIAQLEAFKNAIKTAVYNELNNPAAHSIHTNMTNIYTIITKDITFTPADETNINLAITTKDNAKIMDEATEKFGKAFINAIKNAQTMLPAIRYAFVETTKINNVVQDNNNNNNTSTKILKAINEYVKININNNFNTGANAAIDAGDDVNVFNQSIPTITAICNIMVEYITTVTSIYKDVAVIRTFSTTVNVYVREVAGAPGLTGAAEAAEAAEAAVNKIINQYKTLKNTRYNNGDPIGVNNASDDASTSITNKVTVAPAINNFDLVDKIKALPIKTDFHTTFNTSCNLEQLYKDLTTNSTSGGYINYMDNEDNEYEKNRVDYNTLQINNINLSGGAADPPDHPQGYTIVLTNLIGSRKNDIHYIQQVNEYSKNMVNSDNKKYEMVKGLRNIQLRTIYNLIKINTGHNPDVIIGNLGCILKDTNFSLKTNTAIIDKFSEVYKTDNPLPDRLPFADDRTRDNIKQMIDKYYIGNFTNYYNIPILTTPITSENINNNFDTYFESITDYYCERQTTINTYTLSSANPPELTNKEMINISTHPIERDKLLYKITKKSSNETNSESIKHLSLMKKSEINEIFNLLNTLLRYFSVGRKGYLQRDFGCFTIDSKNEDNHYGVRNYDKLDILYTLNFPTFIETLLNQKTGNFNSVNSKRETFYYSENQLSYNQTGDFDKILPIFQQYEDSHYTNSKNSIIDVAIRLLLVPSKHLKAIAGISITDETQSNNIDYATLAQKYAINFYQKSKLKLEERLVTILQEHSYPDKTKKSVIKINDNKLAKPKHLIDLLLETDTKYDKKTKQTVTQLVHINSNDKKLIYNFYEFINIVLKLKFYTTVINELTKSDLKLAQTNIVGGGKVERKLLSFINNNSKAKHISPKYIKKNKNTKKQYKKNTKSTLKNKKHTLKK